MVKVKYDPMLPNSMCYWNVNKLVKSEGGKLLFCWQILQWPGLYVEAHHHAIWQSSQGKLIDITTKDPSDHRLFSVVILDTSNAIDITWPPNIENRYVKLKECPEVDEYIAANHEQIRHRQRMTETAKRLGCQFDPERGISGKKSSEKALKGEIEEERRLQIRMGDAIKACAAIDRKTV
ncbi:hypothetical protein XM52_13815 [Roseovarius indicus]|nr:hypothetical protein XM52_13815 [Roseovarius indicus]